MTLFYNPSPGESEELLQVQWPAKANTKTKATTKTNLRSRKLKLKNYIHCPTQSEVPGTRTCSINATCLYLFCRTNENLQLTVVHIIQNSNAQ